VTAADVLAWLAAAAAALHAGGSLYAALVEHPARVGCGPPMGVAGFRTGEPRAAALLGALALGGAVTALGAAAAGRGAACLAGGLTLALVLLYTRLAMAATARRLRDPSLAPDVPEARALLRRWGALHAVRAALGLVALGLLVGGR
jgi:hypothetical protein